MSKKETMRILFLTETYPDKSGFLGGIFIHNQAVALKNAGHDVAIMFLDFRSLRKKRAVWKSSYTLDGIKIYRLSFPCGPLYPLINALSNQLTLSLYEYAVSSFGKPGIIYAHVGKTGINACSIKRKYGIPYVLLEHDSGILIGNTGKKQLNRQKPGYDNASAVLAVSGALKEQLQKYTVKKVHIVPNIIPEYMFAGKRKKETNSSDFLFISIGNLVKSKSFDLTIKGFAEVAKKREGIGLFIVGEGPEEASLRNLAKELKIEEKIKFYGRMDNRKVAELMRTCDCFVLPSKFETFGMVYVEAMACGLPVIATRCGGPEDFVNDDNGIMIDVDDEAALKEALVEMIDKQKFYDEERIRDSVYNKYSAEVIVEELEKVFCDCLNQSE